MVHNVGDLVEVEKEHRTGRRDSSGGRAFIQKINNNDNQRGPRHDVKYVVGVGNGLSQDVKEGGLSPAPMDTLARRRRSDEPSRPSLLSTHHDATNNASMVTPSSNRKKKRKTKFNTASPLELCKKPLPPPKRNAGLDAMKRLNSKNGKAWLRKLEDLSTGKQLNKTEKGLAMSLFFALRSVEDAAGGLVAVAWGVTRQAVHGWDEKAKANNVDFTRKQRNDKGTAAFNNEKRRKSTFTVQHSFNKIARASSKTPLSNEELKLQFAEASPSQIAKAEQQSTLFLQQAPYLVGEVQRVPQLTNGSITWRRLAAQIAGSGVQPVSSNTIMAFIMSLPESSCKTTRIHPHLSANHKKNRHAWSIQFWVFWENAKQFNSVQLMLGHMDEKWFFGIAVRKHNKSVPFLGVEPVQHQVHHKSHINKLMVVASTAFMPHNNDVERGGSACKLSLTRVGFRARAKKNAHKRVHKSNGTHHCPKRDDNISRRQGELYWEPLEITGGTEGTDKKRKFSPLKWFLEVEIPRLERRAAAVELRISKKIIVRHQMDGAGPHRDAVLLERIKL